MSDIWHSFVVEVETLKIPDSWVTSTQSWREVEASIRAATNLGWEVHITDNIVILGNFKGRTKPYFWVYVRDQT